MSEPTVKVGTHDDGEISSVKSYCQAWPIPIFVVAEKDTVYVPYEPGQSQRLLLIFILNSGSASVVKMPVEVSVSVG